MFLNAENSLIEKKKLEDILKTMNSLSSNYTVGIDSFKLCNSISIQILQDIVKWPKKFERFKSKNENLLEKTIMMLIEKKLVSGEYRTKELFSLLNNQKMMHDNIYISINQKFKKIEYFSTFEQLNKRDPSESSFDYYFKDVCHAFHDLDNLASCLKIIDGTKLRLDLKGNTKIKDSYNGIPLIYFSPDPNNQTDIHTYDHTTDSSLDRTDSRYGMVLFKIPFKSIRYDNESKLKNAYSLGFRKFTKEINHSLFLSNKKLYDFSQITNIEVNNDFEQPREDEYENENKFWLWKKSIYDGKIWSQLDFCIEANYNEELKDYYESFENFKISFSKHSYCVKNKNGSLSSCKYSTPTYSDHEDLIKAKEKVFELFKDIEKENIKNFKDYFMSKFESVNHTDDFEELEEYIKRPDWETKSNPHKKIKSN